MLWANIKIFHTNSSINVIVEHITEAANQGVPEEERIKLHP
ncbi:MAG: hypothetical protein LiPW30_706, partial [Parcubacteria group bacterium LiPW_30]